MSAKSIINRDVVTEESREWLAGYRNGQRAAKIALEEGYEGDDAVTRSYYLIDIPKFVKDAPDEVCDGGAGDPHVVYGMGFGCGAQRIVDLIEGAEAS